MTITTLLRFLAGYRDAIIRVASCRGAVPLGALLVLSAGFAREYDGEDLWHEPWHVLLPLAASLGTSLVLYGMLFVAAAGRTTEPIRFLPSYRRFLSLYWMTAPLAWLYAIPVERWMSPGDATGANLWLLTIVSIWRVLLIARCASVLLGSKYVSSFFVVMLFADTLALALLYFTPLPIFNIMGGVRLTESEAAVRGYATAVATLGTLSYVVWLIGGLEAMTARRRNWTPLQFEQTSPAHVSKSLWALAGFALVVWALVLPYSQPPQRLRRIVEQDLQRGRIEAALQTMSEHPREAFPPHWDPPPWPGYGQDSPPLLSVLQAVLEVQPADWVRRLFLDKLISQIERGAGGYYRFWRDLNNEQFLAYMDVMEATPELHEVVRTNVDDYMMLLHYQLDNGDPRRERLVELLETLGVDTSQLPAPDDEQPTGEADQR